MILSLENEHLNCEFPMLMLLFCQLEVDIETHFKRILHKFEIMLKIMFLKFSSY